jgi:hypothetical protein
MTRTDTRTFRRTAAAIMLPLGPLCVAVLRGILPYYTADDSRQMLDHTAAGLARMDAVLWLGLAAALTLVPSALAAARLAQRRAPRLALTGVVLLTAGYLTLPLVNNDALVRAALLVPRPDGVRLLDFAGGLAPVTVAGAIFVAGHIVGLVVIGVALWRARAVPAWAAIVLIVSQPLHLVFAVIVPNHPLDAAAWGLTALGLFVAALRVLRTPNDDWDLAPVNGEEI